MSRSLQPDVSPGLLLWRVTLAWQREVSAALKPLALTHVQFVLLTSTWWLTDQAGEHPNQKRVAEFAGTDVMMTSTVLRTLEAKGLIRRRADPHDARTNLVEVTNAGRGLALESVQAVEDVDTRFFGRADVARLLPILRTLSGTDEPSQE